MVWCFLVLFVSRLNPDYNNVLCVGGGGVIISCLAPPIVNNFTLKKWGEVGVVYSGTGILMEGMGVSGDNSKLDIPPIVFIICRPTFILHDKKKMMRT